MRLVGVPGIVALFVWLVAGTLQAEDPSKVFAAARHHLGGPRLDKVQSLEIDRAGATIQLMFPGRMRIELPTSFGPSVTVLDGDVVWQRDPPSPPGGATPPPTSMTDLVTRERRRMAEFAAIYLLRPLPPNTFRVVDRGVQTFWDLTGRVIELSSEEFEDVRLVLDAKDHHPLALVWKRRFRGSTDPSDLVARLEDYREVAGMRFPFSVRFQIVNQAGMPNRELVRYRSARVIVEPPLDPALFKRPRLLE
jgi:hypothetical protein